MFIHSTCRDCGGSLLVTNTDDAVHPTCTPKPTKLERLTTQWLQAIQNFEQLEADLIEEQINQLNNRPPRLRDAALAYAEWGWPVFPLKPKSKVPVTKHGFKDATTDRSTIEGWWTGTDYNIGLPTGHAFDVIDIDIPEGMPTYQQLAAEDRSIHGWVVTASGGSHFYITPTGRGNHTRWLPGTDYRGKGGYVVAPPSTLGEPGRSWSWLHRPSPHITGVGDTYAK